MNNNEPPQKKTQNWGKTSIFHTFETIPDTPKTNLLILKPQKNKPPKHHFAMFKNNPLFFINFLFFQHTVFVFEKLCFAENTIKIVFSGKHSFSETQLSKPTFSTMSKNTFFKETVSGFGQFPLKPLFLWFFLLYTVLVQKEFGQNR